MVEWSSWQELPSLWFTLFLFFFLLCRQSGPSSPSRPWSVTSSCHDLYSTSLQRGAQLDQHRADSHVWPQRGEVRCVGGLPGEGGGERERGVWERGSGGAAAFSRGSGRGVRSLLSAEDPLLGLRAAPVGLRAVLFVHTIGFVRLVPLTARERKEA